MNSIAQTNGNEAFVGLTFSLGSTGSSVEGLSIDRFFGDGFTSRNQSNGVDDPGRTSTSATTLGKRHAVPRQRGGDLHRGQRERDHRRADRGRRQSHRLQPQRPGGITPPREGGGGVKRWGGTEFRKLVWRGANQAHDPEQHHRQPTRLLTGRPQRLPTASTSAIAWASRSRRTRRSSTADLLWRSATRTRQDLGNGHDDLRQRPDQQRDQHRQPGPDLLDPSPGRRGAKKNLPHQGDRPPPSPTNVLARGHGGDERPVASLSLPPPPPPPQTSRKPGDLSTNPGDPMI